MKPIKVAYVTSVVMCVPYTYAVLMKKLGLETVLYRRKIDRGYGGKSGNPLNVDIRYLNDNPILRYIQILKLNNEYDIIHLHDGGGILEAVFCGFGKAKIIYHFHGSTIREGATNFNVFTWIKKMYWKHVGIYSKVIVSTEDLLPHWEGSELILDPRDLELIKVQRNQNMEQPYILSPHWCDDGVKGTFMVFTAWDLLKPKFPNFKLHVINWGKDAPYYKNQTKDDDSVVWHELLPRGEFLKLMAGATVSWGEFIIPAYGLTEIEAFTLGVPDVSDPDITEVELAEYTEKLILDDNLRLAVLEKQRQIAIKYDSDIISKRMYDIYMDVLK
jgi:hypothetical protein